MRGVVRIQQLAYRVQVSTPSSGGSVSKRNKMGSWSLQPLAQPISPKEGDGGATKRRDKKLTIA